MREMGQEAFFSDSQAKYSAPEIPRETRAHMNQGAERHS